MSWCRLVLLTLPALAVAINSAKADKLPPEFQVLLEKAEQFEVLSLSPDRPQEKPKDAFHGWKVLGKTTLKDGTTRKKLVAVFKKGVEEADKVANCFKPRHGIRVTRDGKATDFVICFECARVQVFVGEKQVAGFRVTASPQSTVDSVLKEAKVPLAPKAGK